jgi:hypothetical protein
LTMYHTAGELFPPTFVSLPFEEMFFFFFFVVSLDGKLLHGSKMIHQILPLWPPMATIKVSLLALKPHNVSYSTPPLSTPPLSILPLFCPQTQPTPTQPSLERVFCSL